MIINCDLFAKYIGNKGFFCSPIYKDASFFKLRIGCFLRKLKVNPKYNISTNLFDIKDEMIIVFDSGLTENSILKWIAQTYSDKRLIFFYWNPVRFSIKPRKIPKQFEIWSYSPSDCERYDLKYNSTFYFPNEFNISNSSIKDDAFFIGKDKGRKKKITKLENIFKDNKIKYNFYITATHPRFQKKGYKRSISYTESLDMMSESKSIVDFYMDPTAGLSLRVMESIYFKKKLITNNQYIKDYNLYNESNVFILEKDNCDSLVDFINAPYVSLDEKILKEYTFDAWISRFGVK